MIRTPAEEANKYVMDWHQLWEIVSAPDNVPIVALLFLVPFYIWYGVPAGFCQRRLIAKLEADPAAAKTPIARRSPTSRSGSARFIPGRI